MKTLLLAGALLLALNTAATAGQRVCFPVETNRVMDNGYRVTQVVCAEEGRPLPLKLRILEEDRAR